MINNIIHTECITELDYRSEMIIFKSIISNLKMSAIF
jgi:hypothetical protein